MKNSWSDIEALMMGICRRNSNALMVSEMSSSSMIASKISSMKSMVFSAIVLMRLVTAPPDFLAISASTACLIASPSKLRLSVCTNCGRFCTLDRAWMISW